MNISPQEDYEDIKKQNQESRNKTYQSNLNEISRIEKDKSNFEQQRLD